MRIPQLKVVNRLSLFEETSAGLRVLNLGCADATRAEQLSPWEHVQLRVARVASEVLGIDTDAAGLERLHRRYGTAVGRLRVWDACRLKELAASEGLFDVVIAGEVIEHVSNPGLLLDGAKFILKSTGVLLLSTPNAFSARSFLHAALRRTDISSDHHVVVFSFSTLGAMLYRHGFEILRIGVTRWRLTSLRSRLAGPLLDIVHLLAPQLADTIVCVAKPFPTQAVEIDTQ